MTETRIISFILRFIQPDNGEGDRSWHGVVRHVQSREEARFTQLEEVVNFLNRYVPVTGGLPQQPQPAYSRFVSTPDVRLHYLDYAGSGGPLLLLPGLTANARMFEALVAAGLGDRHRVLALDWRGRGLSDRPLQGYSMQEHAADAIALLDHLGLETTTVAGHSFGGLIALYLAAHYPERVRRLVLMDTSEQLVNERTRALVQSTLDRLGERFASLEAYLAPLRKAPHLAPAWDEMLERYYRSDVEIDEDGTVQCLSLPAAIAETIEMEFAVPWKELVAEVQQPALLLNALESFGAPGTAPILPRPLALMTVQALADCAYLEVPGNHITMLFGENARRVAGAITHFTGGD